jgi:hypothetical protein
MSNFHLLEFPAGRGSHIAVAKSMLSSESCSQLVGACRDSFEKLFYPGPTLGGVQKIIKHTSDFNYSYDTIAPLNLPQHSTFMKIESEVNSAVNAALSLYLEEYEFLRTAPNPKHTGWRLQKYEKGQGYYRVHIDGDVWTGGQSTSRVLGVILYLNTVDIGGETIFPDNEIRVKANAGDIALFPANWTHPHCGAVPISDDKWIISTFIMCDTPEPYSPYLLQNKDMSQVQPTVVGE